MSAFKLVFVERADDASMAVPDERQLHTLLAQISDIVLQDMSLDVGIPAMFAYLEWQAKRGTWGNMLFDPSRLAKNYGLNIEQAIGAEQFMVSLGVLRKIGAGYFANVNSGEVTSGTHNVYNFGFLRKVLHGLTAQFVPQTTQ